MEDPEILELSDSTRTDWRSAARRPVRTYLWRPSDVTGPTSLVLLSHGSGGCAADLTWLAEALAGDGFLVAAVDHYGNNCLNERLPEGSAFWWERAPDLTLVRKHLETTEDIGHVGVAGYSLGGYSAAALLGARIDPGRFHRLLSGEPVLPIPPDRPDVVEQTRALIARYGRETLEARARLDYRDPRVSAGVLLAPAICPILEDASLAAIDTPVLVRWGDNDQVESAADNGRRYSRLIPGADGRSVGEEVGHFEFGHGTPDGVRVRADVLRDVVPFFRSALTGQPGR